MKKLSALILALAMLLYAVPAPAEQDPEDLPDGELYRTGIDIPDQQNDKQYSQEQKAAPDPITAVFFFFHRKPPAKPDKPAFINLTLPWPSADAENGALLPLHRDPSGSY